MKNLWLFFISMYAVVQLVGVNVSSTEIKTFKHQTEQLSFEIQEFPSWKIKVKNGSLIYFEYKGTDLPFDISPPNIAILSNKKFRENQSEILGQAKKNPNQISYTIYFLKGFERRVVKFELSTKLSYLMMPDDYSEYGLNAKDIEKKIIKTFEFR